MRKMLTAVLMMSIATFAFGATSKEQAKKKTAAKASTATSTAKPAAQSTSVSTPTTTTASAPLPTLGTASGQDSPLVAAAKSARAGTKAKVSIDQYNLISYGRPSVAQSTYTGANVTHVSGDNSRPSYEATPQTNYEGQASNAAREQQLQQLNNDMTRYRDAELDPTAYEMDEDDVNRGITQTQDQINQVQPNP